jgi:hypothetical protein
VKNDDLVVATHGRAFWILDDVTPLRELAAGRVMEDLHLFPPRPTVRQTLGWSVDLFRGPGKNYSMGLGATLAFTEEKGPAGETVRKFLDGGENPPNGVIIYYHLPEKWEGDLSLTLLDEQGNAIRTYTPKPPAKEESTDSKPVEEPPAQTPPADERFLPAKPGLNRFVWDLRYPNATKVPGDLTTEKSTTGPRAAPGDYQVQIKLGERTLTECFRLAADPRVSATTEDLQKQFALGLAIRDKVDQVHTAINRLRKVREQVAAWRKRAADGDAGPQETHDKIITAAKELESALTAVETELIQTEAKTGSDRLRLKSRLNTKLIGLISVVSSADAAPTSQAHAVFDHLSAQVDDQLAQLHHLLEEDVQAFNELVQQANLTPVG